MNTKLLMTLCAMTLGAMGVALSFLPHEILSHLNLEPELNNALIMQVLGAVYFGFAIMNWMAKSSLIGGIYGRPIATGNFAHFLIGCLALGKGYFSSRELIILALFLFYFVFAVLFTVVLYRHPVKKTAG